MNTKEVTITVPANCNRCVPDQYVDCRYVTTGAAGGSTRIWLSELPTWLADRQEPTLVVALRVLS